MEGVGVEAEHGLDRFRQDGDEDQEDHDDTAGHRDLVPLEAGPRDPAE
jgi:hypothetical protein